MRLKRMSQAACMLYILFLFGMAFPDFVTGGQVENQPEAGNAFFYVTDILGEETAAMAAENDSSKAEEKPKIAITFDDGPNAVWTPKLLDGLKERNVKATFFLIGQNIEKGDNREIVKRMHEEGHLIGNHTYHHVEISKVKNETAYQEIAMTNDLITEITGETVEYMRPPFGSWQKELEQKIHVFPVMWTIDPLDWATENVDEIVNKVVTAAGENDMILLHDCYKSSVKAAFRIIDLLKAEGYEFVTVDELIIN